MLIAGCAALLGGAANEVQKDQDAHAITRAQFDAMEVGWGRSHVVQAAGVEPGDAQDFESEGLPGDVIRSFLARQAVAVGRRHRGRRSPSPRAGRPGGQQKYPKIGDVIAYNGKVAVGGRTVGRVDGRQIITDAGNGRGGGDLTFIATDLVQIGGHTIALGSSRIGTNPSEIVSGPINGGTGRYSGAEGVAAARSTEMTPDRQTEHSTLTFVP